LLECLCLFNKLRIGLRLFNVLDAKELSERISRISLGMIKISYPSNRVSVRKKEERLGKRKFVKAFAEITFSRISRCKSELSFRIPASALNLHFSSITRHSSFFETDTGEKPTACIEERFMQTVGILWRLLREEVPISGIDSYDKFIYTFLF